MRGMLPDEIKQKSQELLGYEITQEELGLMLYVMHWVLNDENLNSKHVNNKEKELLTNWEDKGFIKSPFTSLKVTKEFYDKTNELLWIGYIVAAERDSMNDKTFLEMRSEEIKKLNVQFLEHLKTIMALNPFCNKFEFIFDGRGHTVRSEKTGYLTHVEKPKGFNDVIFHKLVKDDVFFTNCEIFKYESKEGFYILVNV